MSRELNVKIGLEIHVQITSLKTKLFCSCSADYRGKPPNTNVCPVCLGLPGSLPVLNMKAVKEALKVALALNSAISPVLIFTRKHYFYPDLPKNYQISQYDGIGSAPIAKGGFIKIYINGNEKIIRIRRINIEEDPGRIVYPFGSITKSPYTMIDYNRSGIALLEIVTEPDIGSPKEARLFVQKLASILEHLGVTNPKLEGAIRVDANVSVGDHERVEIKNIGSLRDLEKALAYEIARQSAIIKSGGKVLRETRHWDKTRNATVPARLKEFEEDYRYFPDPDLPALRISRSLIEEVKSQLPELPDQRIKRFIREYGLSEYLASVLVIESKALADLFEESVRVCGNPKLIASMLVNEMLRWIDEADLDLHEGMKRFNSVRICKVVKALNEGVISIKLLKEYIKQIILKDIDPDELIKKGLTVVVDKELIEKVVDEVFREFRSAVMDALRNPKAVNFLVGQVMRKTRGRADPKLVNEIIRRRLKELEGTR
ncbi:MAG: Asp-tRNA(Asn)/Glu-tRNA(Gln) amidotransferase GatCAB subunit B [Thermoprotei archaeon]|nr:MAG: Asp-tRNA(Asn)/Glu-tRNA(Gln) amidotransferase GatCAB subunit B [Thermoprotei archaeon]